MELNKANEENLIKTDTVSWRVTSADGSVSHKKGEVLGEHLINVKVNGILVFSLTCTPEHLTELVVGSLYTRRLINHSEDIKRLAFSEDGTVAEAELTRREEKLSEARELKPLPQVQPSPERIFEMIKKFSDDGKLHMSTGGAHSCYIRYGNGNTDSFEDIGRHNALDKAVGHMLMMKEKPENCMLFTTGRLPQDMVLKVIAAGIPVVITKAVPTTKALLLAEEYGLKMICKAWPDSFSEPVKSSK